MSKPALFPLSHAEKRIYITQKTNPDSPMWNVMNSIRIEKALNPVLLRKAISTVHSHHQNLRLRFMEKDGEIVQYDERESKPQIRGLDFIGHGGEKAYKQWLAKEIKTPIQLADEAPHLFVIAAISQSVAYLCVKLHHISSDGHALASITSQIIESYEQLCQDGPILEKSEEKTDFLETIALEQNYLTSQDAKDDEEYWLDRFKTSPDVIELSPRTPGDSLDLELITRHISPELNKKIFSFCKEQHQSPFRLFLAALSGCLARRSGKTDLSIGSATFNRGNSQVADTVTGMFVATIPLRIQCELEHNFSTLLADVRTCVKGALSHQRYPYDLLVTKLRETLGETPDLLPINVVQFVRPTLPEGYYFNFVAPSQSLSSLTIYLSYDTTGKEDAETITMYGTYVPEVINRSETDLLMNHILNLLSDAIRSPEKPLHELTMLSDREHEQILHGFNTSSNRYPTGQPINVWIEEQVQRNPDKTAVVYRDRHLSYRELNGKANQLARKLRDCGVVPDSVVGLWAERCLELIIGQLAILKAGGAFMPIDEKYPMDRVEFMMEDSKAPVLLTQHHFAEKVDFDTQILALDDLSLFEGDETDLAPVASEDDLAVLIYTSGSTGKPKGVMIEHKSMSNFIFVSIDDLSLTEADAVAKHASFSFDASNLEIYPCLCAGAALHLIPEEIRLSLGALNEYYEKNTISFAMFTTQLGEQFMDLTDNRSLRTMIVGGEKLRSFHKRQYQLINGYGPSECTVMSSGYPVTELEDNIPIGRPLTNYQTLILDSFGNLQPVGVPGELCICGVSVARGYLNRPEKTAEAFANSPLDPNERMYRTNDLAYWRPDGNLVYLGRMDRQVKLRGYRVELGEIEQAILAVSAVTEAAVIDLLDDGGRLYLCGYFVASEQLDIEALKTALQESLPLFMIPARMMQLDALPVTPNGKIDRKQMPVPKLEEPHPEMFVPPKTETEQRLAKIWVELLKHDKIGRNDNFFHIGGDSLKSVSLQVIIEQQFKVSPTVTGLFKAATLEQQSELIDSLGQCQDDAIAVAAEATFYPTTVSQKQLYILSCFKDAGTVYNMPFRIELRGPVDQKRLSQAVHSMVENFTILRTSFEVKDGQPVQILHPDIYLKMEYSEETGANPESLAAGFVRPFNLAKPPLFRVKLVRLGVDHHVLLIDIHHIISDGVSVGLFMEHLSDIYNTGEAKLPEVQFKDFAVWNQSHADDETLARSGRFWEQTFAEPPEVELPTDRPRPPQVDFNGGVLEFVLDQELTAGIKQAAQENGATLHHALMTILAILIGNYTEKDDLVLGTTTAGRYTPGTGQMMGMFVNTLPVRIKPAADKTFSELLLEVRNMMLQVLDHEAYPIDMLYEKLGINRGPGQNPLFDVNFVLRNMEQRQLHLDGGVEASLQLFDSNTAKFDISFAAEEIQVENEGEARSSIKFHIEYRSTLFDHETIQRMARHFMRIAAHMSTSPTLRLSDIKMLHPDENIFLRYTINDTFSQAPTWPSVSRAFENNVRHFPDDIAVVAAKSTLSYQQLNEQANRFAGLLLTKSLEKDTIIGIVADRSAEAVVGMLGALKAGAAYVGIDPGYPEERINFILKDTAAPLLAGNSKGLKSFSFQGEKIALDNLPDELSVENPAQTVSGTDLAYIIFTSGSTGTPKGVMIEHHAMVNFIDWYIRFNSISEDENCAEFAAFSFDVSVAQVFAPLTAGAALHIIPEDMRRNPFELDDYFNANSITHAHLPTRFAEQFMRAVENTTLKRIVVGGDRLTRYQTDARYRIINEYGPSETCMASTALTVSKEYERVPIGTPIANTCVYILGKNNEIRPIGLPGELCISGAGVARGYLNRPELTAEKFITDPFDPDQRMYKTGDMARILPDGNIDFIGRKDFQVKIRGYRIEPGEIEDRLVSHPKIENCIVIPLENPEGGDKSLCAYYEASQKIETNELKKLLAEELPDYMVPSFFVQMEKLPLNRNGKIDRQHLPRPELQSLDRAGKILPTSEKEKNIAVIWEKVTGFSKIGIHDNFFDIGGDSLKAIILMVELQSILDISTNDVFTYPTIAGQAANIKDAEDAIANRIQHLKELTQIPDPSQNPEIQSGLAQYRQSLEKYNDIDLSKGKNYTHILLTGATGTLGVYLLEGLLRKTRAELTLIVRGKSDQHCLERVQKQYEYSFGKGMTPKQLGRIKVIKGNLSTPEFELAKELYTGLINSVDCIIHSAANVRHAGEYEEFRLANVVSTEQLLSIAGNGEQKADFHYISTTSVGAGKVADQDAVLFTEEALDVEQECENVYVRSKIAAEKLVHQARERGINAHIFRAGNITVDSRTGAFQRNIDENGFFQQIRAYLNIGAAPDTMDVRNISFVDCVSEAILTLFDRAELQSETFHIENPHQVSISKMLTAPELDLTIEKMSFSDFVDFFTKHYGKVGFGTYLDRLMMHLGWVDFLNNGPGTVFIRPLEKTLKLLNMTDFSWPEPQPAQLQKLIEHACSDRLTFFGNIALFDGLSTQQLLKISKNARMVFSDEDTLLFRETEQCDFMTLVADGNIELNRQSAQGWIGVLRIVGTGTPIGISNLRDDSPLPWTGEAVGDLLWYKIDHDLLRELMRESSVLPLNIISELQQSLTTLSRFVIALN